MIKLLISKNNTYLLFWFSLTFLLLFKFLIITHHTNIEDILYSDQIKYWKLSDLLLKKKYFDEDFGFLRMPIYPLFLSFIRSISDEIIVIIITQTALGFFNIYLIYKISLFFDKKIGYLVICLSLININLINSSTFILTEAVFLTFYLYFLYFLMKYIFAENINYKNNLNNIILSAVFLALASLTRPITIYYMAILPLIFFRKEFFSEKFISLMVFILVYSITISPWNFRNLNYYDSYGLSSSVADNLNGYYLPYIIANDSKISLIDARKKIQNDEILQKINDKDEDKKKKYFFERIKNVKFMSIIESWVEGGLKQIFAPAIVETFYNLNVKKTSYSSIQLPSFLKQVEIFVFRNENKNLSYLIIFFVSLGIVFKIIMCNYFIKTYKKEIFLNVLLLSLLLLNLAIVGPLGSARYRLAVEPILIIYTSLSIKYLFTKVKLFNFY